MISKVIFLQCSQWKYQDLYIDIISVYFLSDQLLPEILLSMVMEYVGYWEIKGKPLQGRAVNILAPGRCGNNFKIIILKLIIQTV